MGEMAPKTPGPARLATAVSPPRDLDFACPPL